TSGSAAPGDSYTVNATTSLSGITAVRLDVLSTARPSTPELNKPKAGENGSLIELSSAPLDSEAAPKKIILKDVSADFSSDRLPAGYTVAGKANTAAGRRADSNAGTYRTYVFETARDPSFKSGTRITFKLAPSLIESSQFRIIVTTSPRPVATS